MRFKLTSLRTFLFFKSRYRLELGWPCKGQMAIDSVSYCGHVANMETESKTRFQMGYFFKNNASLTQISLHSHSPSLTKNRHSLTHRLTLSHSPAHSPSHSLSLTVSLSTLSTINHSPSLFSHPVSTLSLHYFTFISFAKRIDQATASFEFFQSTRSLKTKKKKVSCFVPS